MNLSGSPFDYVIAFFAGVVVSFSPCVYPVIPLTASFIGAANTKGTKLQGFLISLVYVLGLAVTYCTLGAFAALTGKVFGQFQNSPIVAGIIATILLLFALILLDIIPLPLLGGGLQGKIKAKNLWTVFLLGLVSGFIIGPCTAPILGAILLFVAGRENIFYGISLLFVFSYGVGTLLILIGTFSGLLSSLPKSGTWLLIVKRVCAAILLIAAGYFMIKAGRLIS
ncbi:MAG: cytochrome c biogenesis protein CcdA [Candidatus Omnitrophota bacterium]